jgi:hypothetical protein
MASYTFTTDKEAAEAETVFTKSPQGITESENVEPTSDGLMPQYVPERSQLLTAGDARRVGGSGGEQLCYVEDTGERRNGLHQSNQSRRPTLQSNVFDGLPSFRFQRSSQTHLKQELGEVVQPFQFFALLEWRELEFNNGGQKDYIFADYDNDVKFGFYSENSSPRNTVRWMVDAGTKIQGGSISRQRYVVNVLVSGSSTKIKINGSEVASGDAGGKSLRHFYLGGRQSNNNASVDILEYLFYPNDVSADENKIESYLDRDTDALPTGGSGTGNTTNTTATP